MPTWFKFKAKERKCIATLREDEIVSIPTMEWINYPTQVDLETKRISHFQPLVIQDVLANEEIIISATLVFWTNGDTSYINEEYNDFKDKLLPKYNKLIDSLDVILKLAENIASTMSDQEIAMMMKKDAE